MLERPARGPQVPSLQTDAAERAVSFNHRMRVACRIGNPDGLVSVLDCLAEVAEMGKRQPEPRSGPGGKEWRQPGSVSHALIGDRMHGLPEERTGLHQVSDGEVRLGQPVCRLDLEPRVLQLAGDLERLSGRLARASMVAHVPQPRPDIRHDEPQAVPVTNLPGERLGFTHAVENVRIPAQGCKCGPRVEAKVDSVDLRIARRGQMPESTEGVIEGNSRLTVRRAPRCLEPCLAEVPARLVPELASEGMVAEPFNVLLEPIGVKLLERSGHPSMQFAALWLEEL